MTAPQETTSLQAYLALRHQREQEDIAAQTALGLAVLWKALQFFSLNDTQDAWVHGSLLEIEKQFNRSVSASSQFVQDTLWAVKPDADVIATPGLRFPVERVRDSLIGAGPGTVKSKTRLEPELAAEAGPLAMAIAQKNVQGAGIRHVMDGGRETVAGQTQLARFSGAETIGYARFTENGGKNSPCYFCAMLASRGAVFAENAFLDSSKKFEGTNIAAVHHHCKCSLRPVFLKKDSMDQRAKFFKAQWDKFGVGDNPINNFRRNYTPPPPYSDQPFDTEKVATNRQRLISKGFAVSSPQVQFFDRLLAA